MQKINNLYNSNKTFFSIKMMLFSLLGISLCSEKLKIISDSELTNPETQQMEANHRFKSEVHKTNINELINICEEFVDSNISTSKNSSESVCGYSAEKEKYIETKSQKILKTVFDIFASLNEFKNSNEYFNFKNENYNNKFMNLCKIRSESEKKLALQEFYRIYIQGHDVLNEFFQGSFINYFIKFINIFCENYNENKLISIDSKLYFLNFNVLFFSGDLYVIDAKENDKIKTGLSFYDENLTPLFTSEGLIFKNQKLCQNSIKSDKKSELASKNFLFQRFSKYLIFDAKENLNFFFEYFKNDNFTVNFQSKTYEFIGFVLENENYDYFIVSDNSVSFKEIGNTLNMNWSQFKVKYEEKYGSINVIAILKKIK